MEFDRVPSLPALQDGTSGLVDSGDASTVDGLISLEAEVPEVLFNGMRDFIHSHPHWDQYSLISSALASFLFQNGCNDHQVSKHYLDGLFQRR